MRNFEDVNGVVIGSVCGQCWVTYEGRRQGKVMIAEDYPQADDMCWRKVQEIKNQCGEAFEMIFPNKDGWKFHFDGI